MKRVVLTVAVMLVSLTAFAQMDIIPVDWNSIKEIVSEKPDEVKALVDRLCQPALDTTLTYNDRVIAFFGQAVLSDDKEQALANEVVTLFNKEEYAAALGKAKEALAINPLNIRVLDRAGRCILYMIDGGDESYKEDDAILYFNRAMRLFNTIAITGFGDEEYPFCVTTVADEYEFMQNYLDLYEYESQSLIGHCDVFKLKETSKYYPEKEIWFDATRPLQQLDKLLGF